MLEAAAGEDECLVQTDSMKLQGLYCTYARLLGRRGEGPCSARQAESRAYPFDGTGQNPCYKKATGKGLSLPYAQQCRATLPCFKLEKMLKVPRCLLLPGALLPDGCAGQTQLPLGPAPFLTPFWQLMTLTEVGISLGIIAKILLWAAVRLHTAGHVSDTHPRHHDSATQ